MSLTLSALTLMSQIALAEEMPNTDVTATSGQVVEDSRSQLSASLGLVYGMTAGQKRIDSGIDSMMPSLGAEWKNCSALIFAETAPLFENENVTIPIAEMACTGGGVGPVDSIKYRFSKTITPMIPTEGPVPHGMPWIGYPDLGIYDDIEVIDEGVLMDVQLKNGLVLTPAVLEGTGGARLGATLPDLMLYASYKLPQLDQLNLQAGAQYSLDSNDVVVSGTVGWEGERLSSLATFVVVPNAEALDGGAVAQAAYKLNPEAAVVLAPIVRVSTPDLTDTDALNVQVGLNAQQNKGPFVFRAAVEPNFSDLSTTSILANASVSF